MYSSAWADVAQCCELGGLEEKKSTDDREAEEPKLEMASHLVLSSCRVHMASSLCSCMKKGDIVGL